ERARLRLQPPGDARRRRQRGRRSLPRHRQRRDRIPLRGKLGGGGLLRHRQRHGRPRRQARNLIRPRPALAVAGRRAALRRGRAHHRRRRQLPPAHQHRSGPVKRWLKWLLLSLGALLLLVALLVTFALNSEYALRRGLAFAAPLIPDSLEYREVNGTLAGRIELVDVRYRVAGTEVVAERLTFSPSLLPLIGRRIELGAVEARRLVVTLPAPDPEADEDAAPPDPRRIIESLRLPVAIQADSVAIDGLAIARADETVLALDALRLSLEWTDAFMDIRALEINGKEISLRGDAHLALAGNEHTRLAIEGSTSLLPWPLAASLAAEGNLAALDVNGRLQEPFGAQLSGRLADVLEGIRWQGQLAIPELVPATFGEGLA